MNSEYVGNGYGSSRIGICPGAACFADAGCLGNACGAAGCGANICGADGCLAAACAINACPLNGCAPADGCLINLTPLPGPFAAEDGKQ